MSSILSDIFPALILLQSGTMQKEIKDRVTDLTVTVVK